MCDAGADTASGAKHPAAGTIVIADMRLRKSRFAGPRTSPLDDVEGDDVNVATAMDAGGAAAGMLVAAARQHVRKATVGQRAGLLQLADPPVVLVVVVTGEVRDAHRGAGLAAALREQGFESSEIFGAPSDRARSNLHGRYETFLSNPLVEGRI